MMITSKIFKNVASSFIFSILFFNLGSGSVLAQQEGPTESSLEPPFWQYSAKFICGPQQGDGDVVRGVYRSTINIHNSSPTREITFLKKAVVAFPEREKYGNDGAQGKVLISKYHHEFLLPDDAMGVDCRDILILLQSPNAISNVKEVSPRTQIEGFVVIQVKGPSDMFDPLDVIGKYSARPFNDDVHTLDVKQVPGKLITGAPQ
ncbi:MAG: hypothetical protein IPI17_03435 [Nitrosomonas sp.]|jgi:hypothetical protein|nr:hypothetical protein [Nitrosomonas sp.]